MVLAVLAMLLGGCQTYERKPLDLDATRSAWRSRSAADPSVRAFAATLEGAETRGGIAGTTVFDPSDGLTLAEADCKDHPETQRACEAVRALLARNETRREPKRK